MKIALLSDLHANVTALNAVLIDLGKQGPIDAIALLGDLINYGPRPNETIDLVKHLDFPLLVNLWGNHEYSVFGGSLERFATARGRSVLQYTESILTAGSRLYLDKQMEHPGIKECQIGEKSFLFMHGNLDDPFWGKFGIDDMDDERYVKYDFVISGHTHIPHYVEHFFSSNNFAYRKKKRTVYINPGSVGQPRNHNPYAQYGVLDLVSGSYKHRSVWYNIEEEQKLFSNKVDVFYKERLSLGI